MTIKELKEAIKNLPDDLEVILSKDQEGNDFKYLISLDVANIRSLDDEELEVVHPDDYNELDKEEKLETSKALVLWP